MRGTGKTKAMVEALPETGSIVVVHNPVLRSYVRQMIGDLRGSEVVGVTKIVVIDCRSDADKIVGARKPVYLDHAFVDAVKPEVAARVLGLQAGTNAVFGNRA